MISTNCRFCRNSNKILQASRSFATKNRSRRPADSGNRKSRDNGFANRNIRRVRNRDVTSRRPTGSKPSAIIYSSPSDVSFGTVILHVSSMPPPQPSPIFGIGLGLPFCQYFRTTFRIVLSRFQTKRDRRPSAHRGILKKKKKHTIVVSAFSSPADHRPTVRTDRPNSSHDPRSDRVIGTQKFSSYRHGVRAPNHPYPRPGVPWVRSACAIYRTCYRDICYLLRRKAIGHVPRKKKHNLSHPRSTRESTRRIRGR